MLADLIKELESIENSDIDETFKDEVYNALEKVMTEIRIKNSKGYIHVVYAGFGKYGIISSRYPEEDERLVRSIKSENIGRTEEKLHQKFVDKKIHGLYKLNDQDIYYIQMLPDEWEDESRIF